MGNGWGEADLDVIIGIIHLKVKNPMFLMNQLINVNMQGMEMNLTQKPFIYFYPTPYLYFIFFHNIQFLQG